MGAQITFCRKRTFYFYCLFLLICHNAYYYLQILKIFIFIGFLIYQ